MSIYNAATHDELYREVVALCRMAIEESRFHSGLPSSVCAERTVPKVPVRPRRRYPSPVPPPIPHMSETEHAVIEAARAWFNTRFGPQDTAKMQAETALYRAVAALGVL